MDDRFDDRLRDRLRALDGAVPPETPARRRGLATPIRSQVVRTASAPSWALAAAAVLVLVLLVSSGFVAQRLTAPQSGKSPASTATATGEARATVPPTPAIEPTVIMGSSGFPVSVGGQPVYRLDDRATWQNLNGSLLVAAGAPFGDPSCPALLGSPTPGPAADADLIGGCPSVILFNTAGFTYGSGGTGWGTAPKGLSLDSIAGWGGHIIVLRIHTHDPEAAQCSPAAQAACENALVVEAIVWPSVPDQIDGARVYRDSDQWSGELATLDRSFLLGGVVSVFPAGQQFSQCSASAAAAQLLPYCSTNETTIDGVQIAPSGEIEAMPNEVVVVRAHVKDPLASECPTDVRTACEQSVVVESVVWSSRPYSTGQSEPIPTPSGTL